MLPDFASQMDDLQGPLIEDRLLDSCGKSFRLNILHYTFR